MMMAPKNELLRSSAALSLVGGSLTPSYPFHRFRDARGRVFSVVTEAERLGSLGDAGQFEGYVKLPFAVRSAKAPGTSFEVWVPESALAQWAAEIAIRRDRGEGKPESVDADSPESGLKV